MRIWGLHTFRSTTYHARCLLVVCVKVGGEGTGYREMRFVTGTGNWMDGLLGTRC
ncbi:hypothetical protein PF005_g19000 [Phytophthora fragariae]|uniref:Uncharacterized protein n=1 Tax=Phytophthora fragariae TaxID=53985 RepID=A0A6A3JPV9_9STRA|nr:hypothetical protein PF003_g9142 [Phytophthora fragariae]KAE8935097.1 hypothetical protein PF009_g14940 [Phytophthora fragariae]KAE8993623.1 hypothetical protein PF011_g17060 [Phytophthora fragariae]KAE9090686.1 hypothetical protein PF010_g18491 [Phytophthora fragariae]KAE9121528.1 hypothetical protein PF006_g17878 [Phytophthora fragariae]